MSSALRSFKEAFELQGEIGRLVDVATADSLLGTVDWQLNMQICDKVNVAKTDAIKDGMRTLRARLKTRNVPVQMLALTLLETLVKNCGPELHMQVATKDFMSDLVYLAQPGNADGRVYRKVQQLLHAWGEAFKGIRHDLPLFYDTYQTLLAQGIVFPPYDPGLAPAVVTSGHPNSTPIDGGAGSHGGGSLRQASGWASQSGGLRAENLPRVQQGGSSRGGGVTGNVSSAATFDIDLLNADLAQVNVEVSLLSDMLTAAANDRSVLYSVYLLYWYNSTDTDATLASSESSKDADTPILIKELHHNCRTFQQRIVALIEQVEEYTDIYGDRCRTASHTLVIRPHSFRSHTH